MGSHPRPYVRRPPTYRRRVFFRTTYSNQKCRPTGGIFTILRHGDANCNKKRPSGAFSQLPRRGAPKLQSVRRADTLAAEWVLRASGRGGRGCQPYGGAEAQKAHFFGAPPHFFGLAQRNGVDKQYNVKPNQQQTGELLQAKLPPGGYVRAIPPIWADMRRSVWRV